MQVGICSNCGRSQARKLARCLICYNYLRTTGKERPSHLYEREFNRGAPCGNCGRPSVHAKNRCAACYLHLQKTGKERTSRRTRAPQQMKWCKRCGKLGVYAFNRCKTCYSYRWKKGKDRPKYKFDDDPRCKNCGVPLHTMISSSGKRRCVKGVCENCYAYKRRSGKERPRHLWGDGPHGWCECGYPAVAMVEEIPVCNRHRE